MLPPDVHLTSFREDGGRLRLEGTGRDAVTLLPLLEGSGRFGDARLEGPVQREQNEGATTESFVLSVRALPASRRHPGGAGQ